METIQEPKTGHAADLKALSAKLETVDKSIESLGKSRELKRIIEMIKIRKGWTTPAEFKFAHSIADALSEQLKSVQRLLQNFEKGADLVRESN